jgi:uncharacterized membrane protein YphA (DoxX/SURF4 family)
MIHRIPTLLPNLARLLLGAVFFTFGLNGFLGFLPQPPVSPEGGAFLGALAATGYMFPLIKTTEIVAGALLLSNRFVPLALVLLAPVVVNILAFHALLSPGLALPVVLTALQLYLAYTNREAYRTLLAARSRRQPAHVVELTGRATEVLPRAA